MQIELGVRSSYLACFAALISLSALAQTVTVAPASVSFGNQVQGTSSSTHKVTLKNGQSSASTIATITTSLSDYAATNNCPISPATLPELATCTISITFTPGALGTRSGTLTVVDTGGSSPQLVPLSGTGTAPSLVSIAVTPVTAAVAAGSTQQFTATGTYSNGTTQNLTTTASWTSSNTAVATIKVHTGVATSVAQGTATITATSGAISGTATLAVTAPVLTSIAVSPSTASVAAGNAKQYTATGTYSNGTTQNLTSSVSWSSSATSIATVGSAGLATSLAQGTATITATSGAISGSATLKVTAAVLASIAVTPVTAAVVAGSTQQFTATGTYSNGTTQNLTTTASWTSSNTAVATIKVHTGVATSVAQGTATITATSGAISGTATLAVTAPVLTSIAVSPSTASVAAGNAKQYTATGTYSNGTTQNLTSSVSWSSSATSIATVGSAGLATSLAQGTATITATSGAISGSATLKVTAAVLASIAVTPVTAAVAAGSTQQFTATGTYSNGKTINLSSTVKWACSATGTATVSSGGLAVGVAQGVATISASSGTVSGSAGLTVTVPVLTGISISPGNATIAEGMSEQYTATGTYSDGGTQNLTGTVNWSATAGATIGSGGSAIGVGVGTATITAVSGSITATATLSVGQPVLVSMAVTPANPSFALGTTQPLAATGTYSDGSTLDLTNTVTWGAGNGMIATVNAQGLATSVALGSASVTATSGLITGSTTLTVTPAVLVSIAVTPAIPTIPLGTTEQFTATGSYTDGSMQNITGTVQWSSDTPAVATISNTAGSQGGASSEGQGTATITASVGAVSGSTMLSVTSATLVSLAITPGTASLALGTQQQFTATGSYTDGSTQNLTSTVTWSSDTLSTATINNAGLASSVGTGSANITASSGSVSGTTVLTVTAAALVSITINPAAASIPLGMTQQFSASGTYTDGSTQDVTQSGHWSSTGAGVATISNTSGTGGLATTLGTGTTTIGISLGAVSASAPLIVNPAALATIAITPQAATIALGTSQPFTALGTYTDGSTQDVTSVVTWSSSDATVAIISNSPGSFGVATSSGQGTAIITAISASISSSSSITITQASVSSIAVTPSSISINIGYAEQFTAVATYSDGSSHDITQSAAWTSSSPDVAAVNSTGLAIGMLAGTTTVLASAGSMPGSASLTVSPTQIVNTNAELFGLHIQSTSTPWPTIGFNEVRLWSNESGTRWAQVNTSNGSYNFAVLDTLLAEFYKNGITDVVYTFGQVPKWASSNPTDNTCDYATTSPLYGGCDLPDDINIDGTGTDRTYNNFVAAIATHVNDPTYLQTHAHIRYWEPWNEWYRNNIVSTYKWTEFSIRASYAQMVRMVEDVRCTITGTGSVNGVPCSAPPIDTTAMIVSPSDGNQNCCSGPQVFQNFLYCNGTGSNAPISGSYCTTGTSGSAAVDIINSHWYEGKGREPEDLATDVPVYTRLLSSTDLAKPLWSDEGSWNDDTYVPDPDIQASWVARYYLVGWSTSLVRMYWYAYDSPLYGTLWTSTGGLNPAGQAYNTVYQWIVGSTLTTGCTNTSGTIWVCGIKLANGNSAEAIWDTSQTCSDGSCITRNQSVSSTWTNYQDLTGTVHAIPTSGTVPVGIEPILLMSSSGT